MMWHSSKLKPGPADRLATIWSIIEARRTFPASIVVTSATQMDDTGAIARGLAEVAQSAGQRTGYLEFGDDIRVQAGGLYSVLSMAPRGSQRESFDAAMALWRTLYDVVIVNAPSLGSDGLGAHAARICDGVVISVCDQRRVVSADRKLATLLSELNVSILGVVMTGPIVAPQATRVAYDRPRVGATAR